MTAIFCPLARRVLRRGVIHHKQRATRPAGKRSRPSVGKISPRGAYRRLPDAMASRCAPRLPLGLILSHPRGSYSRSLVLYIRALRQGLLEFFQPFT